MMLLCGLLLASVDAASVRGAEGGRTISVEEVQKDLQTSMKALLDGDDASTKRAGLIEARVWQTFQALPKNDMGRLSPRGVRYLVHNYFMKEHGWLIQGLDPHGNQAEVSEIHEVNILQDKAPALVESLLEARRSNHGLALNDVVTMITALERLIFDESLALLRASYVFNDANMEGTVGQNGVHDILTSYLLLFQLGSKGNLSDARLHKSLKSRISSRDDWAMLVDFEKDAVLNFDFAKHNSNPFVKPQYTFQDTLEIVEELAHSYGKWQNTECRQMKADLMDLDADGDGRIPLGKFYGRVDNTKYQFTESIQYLEEVGALEEKKVRIANYLQGPSNCIASSTYYSLCCLSECEGVLNDLEAKVQAPSVEAMHLLRLVGNISSSTVDAPRDFPPVMSERLHQIAQQNGGEVPLHGRLFAEWLHFAFPNECPYPHMVEESRTLTPAHWLDKKVSVDPGQRIQLASRAEEETTVAEVEIPWTSEEVLHVQEAKLQPGTRLFSFRTLVQVALLLAVLRAAGSNWQTLRTLGAGKEKEYYQLPF
mmetsp:Transcript_37483/g.46374  ORF Transcript_37483/g.46374 Transcript_37483/m.46374 type:complete len:540 (-) Transcript_37483:34-1653(-)